MRITLPKSAVTFLSLAASLGAATISVQANDYPTAQAQTIAAAPQGIAVVEVNAAGKTVTVDAAPADGAEQNQGKNKDGKDGDGNRRGNNPNRAAERAAQEEERRAMFAARIRDMLTKAGFPEVATQDAIIAYIASEEKSKGALRMATRRLVGSLRREAPPERLKDLLAEYKKATEAETKRKEKARADLDTQIAYSKNPRLEAILLISGILDDNNSSSFNMWMMMQPRGGFNGQQRGMQGNPNGNPNGPNDDKGPRTYPGTAGRAPEVRDGVPQAAKTEAAPEALPQAPVQSEANQTLQLEQTQ